MSTALAPCRILIFAKAPRAGQAKTRLIPALGEEGAAALARCMLDQTVAKALAAAVGPVELCAAPAPADSAWADTDLPASLTWSAQGEGDLGARMGRAARRAIRQGVPALLIGTDCPALDGALLQDAAAALADHDACLVPATDGGYVLLGLSRYCPALFEDMPWSTPAVLMETLARLARLGWSVKVFPPLHDIDEAADLGWLPREWGDFRITDMTSEDALDDESHVRFPLPQPLSRRERGAL